MAQSFTPSLRKTDRGRPVPCSLSIPARSPSTNPGRTSTTARSTRGSTAKSLSNPLPRKLNRARRLAKREPEPFPEVPRITAEEVQELLMYVYGKAMDESKREAHCKVVRIRLPSQVA